MIYAHVFCGKFHLQKKKHVLETTYLMQSATDAPRQSNTYIDPEGLEVLEEWSLEPWEAVRLMMKGSFHTAPDELGILRTSSAVRSEAMESFYSTATFVFGAHIFRREWHWHLTLGALAKLSKVELHVGLISGWYKTETPTLSRMCMVINSASQDTRKARQISVVLDAYQEMFSISPEVDIIVQDEGFQALKKLTTHGLVVVKILLPPNNPLIWKWDPDREAEEYRVYPDADKIIQRELEPALGSASIFTDSTELAVTFHPAECAPLAQKEEQPNEDQGGATTPSSA